MIGAIFGLSGQGARSMPERKKFQAHLQAKIDQGLIDFKPYVGARARSVKELAGDCNTIWDHSGTNAELARLGETKLKQRPLNEIMEQLRREAEENARKKKRGKG